MTFFSIATSAARNPAGLTGALLIFDNTVGTKSIVLRSVRVSSAGATAITTSLVGPLTITTLANHQILTLRSDDLGVSTLTSVQLGGFAVYEWNGSGLGISGTSGGQTLDLATLGLGATTDELSKFQIEIPAGKSLKLNAVSSAADSILVFAKMRVE